MLFFHTWLWKEIVTRPAAIFPGGWKDGNPWRTADQAKHLGLHAESPTAVPGGGGAGVEVGAPQAVLPGRRRHRRRRRQASWWKSGEGLVARETLEASSMIRGTLNGL
jgi:hypothetical protein